MTGRTRDWFATLATGSRMLIIFALALLPLGIIAILGSISAARTQRANDVLEAQSILALASQRLNSAITRASVTIRVANGTISGSDPASAARACERAAEQLDEEFGGPVRFALYGTGNQLTCNTNGFAPSELPLLPPAGLLSSIRIDGSAATLRVTLFDSGGRAQGEVVMGAETLRALASPGSAPMPLHLDLLGNGQAIRLFDNLGQRSLAHETSLSSMLMSDRLELRLNAEAAALTTWDWAMILLPVLLWLVAAVIAWLIVDHLLLRPLGVMQKAITAYRPGDTGFEAPVLRGPAREISDLGRAFDQVTRTVARHEAELEAAVERQTRLVREVHHRVKNNLQVVASLLNIHSRGSETDEAAAAYASIQRRVDALAVVHRNHYAELESTPGVALRALISELGASLRASAPTGASRLQIRLSLQPVQVNQDVAVAVAFLITEAVEYAMLCGGTEVLISLEPESEGRARLTIESGALDDGPACGAGVRERFERIMTGLARQLRSTPQRDHDRGRFSVDIAIIGREES
jgi:two-component sensor histidine kinase